MALVLGPPSLARAQNFDPCASLPGGSEATEIPNAGLEMPVPDTGHDWIHAHGSEFHKNNRDTNALDLNENVTQWDFDNGLPALAAAAGIVRFAGNTTCGYGYSVVVEHIADPSFSTHYAHLHQDLMVVVGQRVLQGQVLGYISRTGGSHPNHLHFGVLQGTTAKYADVNGQSTENAHERDLILASDTRVTWFEDFRASPAWEPVGGSVPIVISGDIAILAPNVTVRHEQPVFAQPQNGSYRLSVAAMTLRLGNTYPVARLRFHCLADQQPSDQTILHTVHLPPEWNSQSGWALQSILIGEGADQCPIDARFIRPELAAEGGSGTAVLVDWVAIEERPALDEGGQIRFNSYVRGGLRHHTWSVTEAAGLSYVRVLGASTRGGAGLQVICSFPGGEPNGSCTTDNRTVEHRYYWLLVTPTGGVPRVLGPIGPVEFYQWALVPGLGVARLWSTPTNIPPWADYPYDSFDGDVDTYGIINYAPSTEWVFFIPSQPVSGLTTFQAHYGGTVHRAMVWAQDHSTGGWIRIGDATNTPRAWSVISAPGVWPAVTRQVAVHFDRQDFDEFIHVAEIRFSKD